MASPTTTRMFTASLPTRRHAAAGSKRPSGSVTSFPPPNSMVNASQWALECMNGGHGSAVMPGRITRGASSSGDAMKLPSAIGSPPPIPAKKMSSWRHSTPFGMPVVPPV